MTLQQKLTQVLQAAVDNHEAAGLNLLVRRDGQQVCYAEAGWADVAAGKPIRRDSIFRLYSQTKPVTSAAVMLLIERGIIDAWDPVEKFLPGFANPRVLNGLGSTDAAVRSVTLMDMLSMTAGTSYPDADEPGQLAAAVFAENQAAIDRGEGLDTVAFANRLGELPLAFQPGTRFRYSTCADILGAVVEVASGMPLADFLQKEFFDPLGMKDTAFWVPPEKRDRFVTCYERVPGGVIPFTGTHLCVGIYDRPPVFASGGAGLVSTLDDYAKFAEMLLCGGILGDVRILSPETVRWMNQPQIPDGYPGWWDSLGGYGYGKLTRICTQPGRVAGPAHPGEYGWDGWLGTYFANFPDLHMTILLNMNAKDSGTVAVTRKVRNVIMASL